ncbi:Starch-binding domain-containing protein 1 [Bagarius yarrelli]|uniref:Starch-binding domain-containing protein 1 n=1 Tax=Bagarius yarrelli TaxID=175774 RepID=A0A556TU45_BAGYA|nr:Starch-binding domain-containing protein 1 [Bagarius yarrelli]
MNRHSGAIGGYETAATLLIILFVSLSAWGAFLIYRTVKGRRGEPGSEDHQKEETEKEATGARAGSDDGGFKDWAVDSPKTTFLSSAHHTKTSSDLVKENLTKTSYNNIKDATAEPLTGSSVSATTIVKEDCVIHSHDVCDAAESIIVRSDLFEYQDKGSTPPEDKTENSVKEYIRDHEEPEIEQHVDVDEPSETESAQELLEAKNLPVQKCQSVEDLLDNTLLAQDNINKPSEEDISATETVLNTVMQKKNMEDPEVTASEFEMRMPLMNDDLGSYCSDEHSDPLNNLASEKVKSKINVSLNSLQTTVANANDSLATQQQLSKTLDCILSSLPQNYLGFTVPGLQGDSLAPLQLSDQSKVKTEVTPADISQNKNEINIMESIMDSNEWLSTGPPDTRDLPWLTQTQSKAGCELKADVPSVSSTGGFGFPAEEMMSHQEKTDMSHQETTDLVDTTTAVAKDEMDLLNKRVGTVLPMPQLVQVSFRVHYITHSPKQILAVTGNQQELGSWESFVPLRSVEDGFWFCTVSLPLDSQVEWKFILVEEGKIQRWEECENRCFTVTGQEEEIHLNKNWGYA